MQCGHLKERFRHVFVERVRRHEKTALIELELVRKTVDHDLKQPFDLLAELGDLALRKAAHDAPPEGLQLQEKLLFATLPYDRDMNMIASLVARERVTHRVRCSRLTSSKAHVYLSIIIL